MPEAGASPAVEPNFGGATPESRSPSRLSRDPLGPILALGRSQLRVAAWVGIAGSLLAHAAPASRLVQSFPELDSFSSHVLEFVRDRLRTEVDIDLTRPPPPPPPPLPEPEPEPEPEPLRPVASMPAEPPPAPAQAGKILTAEPDPDEPVDLTDQGFVTGNSDRFAGGVTASTGTSPTAVRSPNAVAGGVPGGTGSSRPVPASTGKDQSRPAIPDTQANWNDCGFPAEADIEGINLARVELIVRVGPEGRAKSVTVLKDPGYGFGKLARACAARKRYLPGLDARGLPVTKTTEPFAVRFTR